LAGERSVGVPNAAEPGLRDADMGKPLMELMGLACAPQLERLARAA
jgi:hypothetical protein